MLNSFPLNTTLAVELRTKPENTRLTFVEARDDDGLNLDNSSGSFGQHLFWRYLKLQRPANVHVWWRSGAITRLSSSPSQGTRGGERGEWEAVRLGGAVDWGDARGL